MSDHQFHEALQGGVAYVLRQGDLGYPLHILMLHGWSGDERVMWVLESVLPGEAPVASLRGIFSLDANSFQWTNQKASIHTAMSDFDPAIGAIKRTISTLEGKHGFDPGRLVLMGFSQGSALCFALAEQLSPPPLAVIALAGYLPQGKSSQVADVPVFWGHGKMDALVPVERARNDVELLDSIGTQVHYCEADVGHKLGIECTRGLKGWLKKLESRASSSGSERRS